MEEDRKIPETQAVSKILERTWIDDDRRKKRRRLINHVNAFIEDGEAWSEHQPVLSTYSSEALAIFNQMVVAPSDARKTLIDSTVVALKAAGIWSLIDIMWVLAAHDAQAGVVNWKSPGVRHLNASAPAPTFAVDRGYTGNGTTSFLSASWQPAVHGVNYLQDSASLWEWCLTDAQSNNSEMGIASTTAVTMVARSTTDNMQARVNDNTLSTVANAVGTGMYGATRASSATKKYWKNGVQLGADIAVASTGISTGSNIRVCAAFSTHFSSKQIAFAALGGPLTGKEAAFYAIMLAYMQGVGAA